MTATPNLNAETVNEYSFNDSELFEGKNVEV